MFSFPFRIGCRLVLDSRDFRGTRFVFVVSWLFGCRYTDFHLFLEIVVCQYFVFSLLPNN